MLILCKIVLSGILQPFVSFQKHPQMSDSENSHEFLSLLSQIASDGMSRSLYEKIACEFTNFQSIPSSYLLSLLKHFVRFEDEPLYVNEIRNYLKENDHELFVEYGNRFKNCKGCFEVFGIQPENLKEYNFLRECDLSTGKEKEGSSEKMYANFKDRKNNDRKIKKQAKLLAAERYKERLERLSEKKKKKEELEQLIRKQDL